MKDYLSTSDVARAAGVHPNTVRRYIEWGLLPPVERTPSGYRRFTQHHVDCMCLARLIYMAAYPGRGLRQSSLRVIQTAATGDWLDTYQEAERHLAQVQVEQQQAELAATLLERWAQGEVEQPDGPRLPIGEAAQQLDVTIDVLRNWERNGLIDVPRDPDNSYRRYGPREISRLRVIRMLSKAGYSMMAMLRMFLQLDRGETRDLRQALDTPRPDEDIYSAADRWLSTLAEQAACAREAMAQVEAILRRSGGEDRLYTDDTDEMDYTV